MPRDRCSRGRGTVAAARIPIAVREHPGLPVRCGWRSLGIVRINRAVGGAGIVCLAVVGNLIIACGPTQAEAQEPIDPDVLRSERPDPTGAPTVVGVSLFIMDVIRVSDFEQSFEADVVVLLSWTDPRLADGNARETRMFALDEVWSPRVALGNQRGVSPSMPAAVRVERDGRVHYGQRYLGTFSKHGHLEEFPFDHQTLEISVVAFEPRERVVLEHDASLTGRREQVTLAGWTEGEVQGERLELDLPAVGRTFEQVVFRLPIRRELSVFLWRAVLPLVLIVAMAWCVFWIDPSYLPSQVGLSTASVFSLIAFQISLRSLLPPVSYLTKADVFIIGSTLLVFTCLGEAVATGYLAKSDREKLARRVDRVAKWIYPFAFLALVAWVFWS